MGVQVLEASTFPLARAVSKRRSRAAAMLAAGPQAPGPAAAPGVAGSRTSASMIASQTRQLRVRWRVDASETSGALATAFSFIRDFPAAHRSGALRAGSALFQERSTETSRVCLET